MAGRAERKLHSGLGEMPGQGDAAVPWFSDFVPPPAARTVLGPCLYTHTRLVWGCIQLFFYPFIHSFFQSTTIYRGPTIC